MDDENFDEDIPERFRHLCKDLPGEEELRKKLYPDVSVIEDAKILCTICLKDVKHVFLLKKKSYKHIILQVVVCKKCMKFYGDGDFSAEEDGDDKYCRWCGQGGKLYLCSKCPSAFCKKCVKQNLERKYVLRVEDDDWMCFICDPKPLFKLRALSWAIDQHLENENKKEEAAKNRKLQAPKTPKSRTVKIPKIDFSDDQFRLKVDSTRLWLSGLIDQTDQARQLDVDRIRADALATSSAADLENVLSSLTSVLDQKIETLIGLKEKIAEGVQKLNETIGQGKKKSLVLNGSSGPRTKSSRRENLNDDSSNDSNVAGPSKNERNETDEVFDDTKEMVDEDATCNGLDDSCKDMFDEEQKPMIRLRNLSDLMDPKLKAQKTPEKSKPKAVGKSNSRVAEKSKPRLEPEVVTIISSSDDEEPKLKKSGTKKASSAKAKSSEPSTSKGSEKLKKSHIAHSTPKPRSVSESSDEVLVPNPKAKKLSLTTKHAIVRSDSESAGETSKIEDDRTAGSVSSSESPASQGAEADLDTQDPDSVPTVPPSPVVAPETDDDEGGGSVPSPKPPTSKGATAGSDGCMVGASDKADMGETSEKQPRFFSSSENDSDDQSEREQQANPSKLKSDKSEGGKPSAKVTKDEPKKQSSNSKKAPPKKVESSSSSSSSDPLSEDSCDEAKKKPAGKKKSVAKSDSDGCGESKTRKKIRRSKKAEALSESDSDDDGKSLLRKKKKPAKKESGKSKEESKKEKKISVKRSRDSGSSSDCDIRKLCDLKSLEAKAGSSGSSDDENEDEKATRRSKKRKTKTAEEKLSDFFDSADDQLGEGEDENLETVYEKEFAHLSIAHATQEDIINEMLKFSSQSEEEGKASSDDQEEEAPSKRSKKPNAEKPEKTKAKRENAPRTKGKKKYADKLMKMKIDSTDSEDIEAGQEKYEKHKEMQAQKKQESSDEDEVPIVKKKPPPKGKKKNAKKMFSDSDDSPIEDVKSDKESEKAESEKADSDSDSDDDKEKKKRKKSSDSDSDSSGAAKKKKRKRIRAASDSESETDSDGGGRRRKKKDLNDSKGRKSIRKILKEDDLKKTTQEALKAEQERKRRIKEKQELYNKMVVKASDAEAPKELTELVLDFDPKTKEKILCVDPDLVKKLKPHQAEGIKFMWDSCFETVKMAKKKAGSGCILAHCMGLGKSLQVVTLVHTLITNPDIGVRKVLVVAPLSTVLNWVNEFDKWLSDVGTGQDVNVFHMNKVQTAHRTYLLKDWDRNGGVLIMGYNLLRNLSNAKARFKASAKKVFQENLVDPGPDVVICDEGHILKNEKTAVNQCMTQIKTRRRIVLTGTPLQNNLVEYHCMVQFVKPNLLGTKKEFTNRFVNPIQNGQFEDSTPHDVKVMKRRAHVLHTMLDGIVQRKDYSVLTPYLPPKFEYVIHLKLSDVQVKLYRYYLTEIVHGGNADADGAPKGRRLFVDFQNLMWICLHPRTLLMKADKDEIKKAMTYDSDEEGSLKDFIDDDKSTSESDFKSSGSSDENSGSEASVKSAEKPAKRGRKTRAQGSASEPEDDPTPVKQWWSELIEDSDMDNIRASSKMFLFFTILKYCEEIGDKLLLFSQSLYTLDILEYFLDKIDTETQKPEEERCPGIKGFEGSWAKGLDYFRLDGSSACENREAWCKSFNRPDNTRARLFLISTRAGGLGINLTGANRVIIFDASWNPSFDVQSLFRVYRFGQDKPCYIYRFLSKGTMEEKIYERQVAKLSTSLRVIDEQQIDRHFSHSALHELYMFDPEGSELQGTPVLPKDRLMAELLQNHKDIILSHHQHDSLLENQEDQELTEEERKAAWQEFENEKNQKPVFQPTFNLNSMASLMVELRTKLQMQNPTWTEEQLRVGTITLLQRLPDYQQLAPYVGFIMQQMTQQQQMAQRSVPQYPGMQFPAFRYPLYNSNAPGAMPMMNNMGKPAVGNNMGVNSMGVGANMMPGNMGLMSQLLNNAGAGTSTANPGIASLLNSMAGAPSSANSSGALAPNPKHAVKTSGAGTATDPLTLNDSGPIELD